MSRFPVFIALAATVLSACAPVSQPFSARLGVTPALGGGSYTSGGGITVAAELRNFNGMTGLCGVWAESGKERQSILTKNKARQVVDSGTAFLNGEPLISGLGFMKKVDVSDGYGGLDANCVATARPWTTSDETSTLSLRIPRQVVHREIEAGVGGMVVLFRPTGPGA